MNVSLSPDAQRAAVSVLDSARNTRDIAIYDLARDGLRTRFTFDAADEFSVIWSPDASRLAFSSSRKGQMDIFQKASSGVGADELLLDHPMANAHPTSWSADGRFLLCTIGNDVWVLPLAEDKKPFPVVQTAFNETGGRFSPDGRWIAYQSNESGGGAEVFVIPFSPRGQVGGRTVATGGKWQVSTTGGNTVRWRRDGKELFYLSADDTLMAAEVNGDGAAFQVGVVRPLFEVRRRLAAWPPYGTGWNYDVSADGQRFLVNTVTEQATPTPITVVVNWTAGLKK
jgi:Tol biopolymer transport system component